MLSRKTEDYLEAIYDEIREKGYVRVKALAERLKVKPPSVSEMLSRLNSQGYVIYRKRSGITLTQEGEKIAKSIRARHDIFEKFLKIIDVPDEIAEKDACILEHHLDRKTIAQFRFFVEFAEQKENKRFFKDFREFCKKKRETNTTS